MKIHKVNPIRIALILYVTNESPTQVAAAINSIRLQSRMPWFVRIVFGPGSEKVGGTRFSPMVQDAVDHLRLFCPNVINQVSYKESDAKAITLAYQQLEQHSADIDVYAEMEADITMKDKALKNLVDPFYDSRVFTSHGTPRDIVVKHPRWERFLFLYFPLQSKSVTKLSAVRNVRTS